MIVISGKVINKVDKEPYKNNKGEMIEQVELDLKDDEERRYNTISCKPEDVSDISEGETVDIQVFQFYGVSKAGNAYLINRFVALLTD